ncbi:MAG: DUF2306 domain-containing protein [Silvibacterium sp.]
MAASTPTLAHSRTAPRRSYSKVILWTILGLAALSVIPFTEFPILHDKTGINVAYRAKLFHDRFLLFPHALGGTLALLSGPLQFSRRFRSRHLKFHRILGRVYVFSVLIAASITFILTQGSGLELGTYVQSGAWIVCTLAALLTARNRQLVQHRQWMIRSYAVTFTFVSLRVLDPWAKYLNMSVPAFVLTIIIVTFASVFLPDIAFNWRELTTSRA